MVVTVSILVTTMGVTHASNWVDVGGNDSVTAEVDTHSLRRTGKKVKVWVRWTNAVPEETPGVYPKRMYLSEKGLSIYDCVARTYINLQVIRYADKDGGEVIDSATAPDVPSHYRDVAPDTIGESILDYACKATAQRRKL